MWDLREYNTLCLQPSDDTTTMTTAMVMASSDDINWQQLIQIIRTHTYIHTYIHLYIYIHTYMHTYIFTYNYNIYITIYTYTHTHTYIHQTCTEDIYKHAHHLGPTKHNPTTSLTPKTPPVTTAAEPTWNETLSLAHKVLF